MRMAITVAFGVFCMLAAGGGWAAPVKGPEFAISYPAAQSNGPLDGRVILLLSRDMSREPRTLAVPTPKMPNRFGDIGMVSIERIARHTRQATECGYRRTGS